MSVTYHTSSACCSGWAYRYRNDWNIQHFCPRKRHQSNTPLEVVSSDLHKEETTETNNAYFMAKIEGENQPNKGEIKKWQTFLLILVQAMESAVFGVCLEERNVS